MADCAELLLDFVLEHHHQPPPAAAAAPTLVVRESGSTNVGNPEKQAQAGRKVHQHYFPGDSWQRLQTTGY